MSNLKSTVANINYGYIKLETPVPIYSKNTGLGPWLALGWVTIQGLDVDSVAAHTVKIPEAKKWDLHHIFWGNKKYEHALAR